ncbi:TetR/AcrR family transcriptional regulator [Brevibacterium antiquum]|uniref:TetR/AcrR family transcriptional regulator n=1 Tax=Brevibacterium antiquum TaxID=234835 RepID=UPI0018DF5B7E|nr:TetR family transcriptional regulator C-terminal domain-containing protein [Brevibacterium antiquum]
MPKLIDHGERREEIASAAWRVILRDGVGAASVRSVAAEAGLSPGSLRHVFASQSQLLAFAMKLVIDRADARVEALTLRGTGLQSAEDIVVELLPIDEERVIEMEVYLALFAASGSDPMLRDARHDVFTRVRNGCRRIIYLIDHGQNPKPEAEIQGEVTALHALLDGLAAHLVWQPTEMDADQARGIIVSHLRELASRRKND